MEIHNQRIKPLLNRSLCLQNVTRYNTFLVKRPKSTLNFKFLKSSGLISSDEYYREIQTKLHKAVKLLKNIRKLDLSEFAVRDPAISQAKLLSVFKRVSKAEIISIKRLMDPHQLSEGYIEKWLRYLPQILHLNWGLSVFGTQRDAENFVNRGSHMQNPLKYLHSCPKIKSLKIDSSEITNLFLQKVIKIKRYPSSLRKLDTKAPLRGEQLNVSQKDFQRLKSLGMTIDPNQNSIPNTLSRMSDLREIDLRFNSFMALEIDTVFANISQKKKLNKVILDFNFQMPNLRETFKALKTCPVTDFSIKACYTSDRPVLEAVSDFIGDMELLENLQIALLNPFSFKEADPLKAICKQVGNLKKLRNLELSFKSEDAHRKGFPLEPEDISFKHLKLESFSLYCIQINSPKPLSHLIGQLENLCHSLQKLTLGLDYYFPDEKSNNEIIDFIKKLENIRELKLPRLDISSIKFLNEIAQTVLSLKFLTSFQLGKISNEVPPGEFAKALGMILSKKGLQEFCCLAGQNFLWQIQGDSAIDMKRIMRRNPDLESISLTSFGFPIQAFNQIQSWV